MTWMLAAYRINCSSCRALISKGEPFRRVTVGRHPWCCACAKRHLGEDPPLVAELREAEHRPSSSVPGVLPLERVGRIAERMPLPDRKRAASGDDQ